MSSAMTDDEIFDAWCASGTAETLQEFAERAQPIVLGESARDLVFVDCRVINLPGLGIQIGEGR